MDNMINTSFNRKLPVPKEIKEQYPLSAEGMHCPVPRRTLTRKKNWMLTAADAAESHWCRYRAVSRLSSAPLSAGCAGGIHILTW